MNRLTRRIAILRSKKQYGAFDRNQYWQERTDRARAARKVRFHLRATQPVLMVTPRWSHAQRFLDDVAVDLGMGTPAIQARTLSLQPLAGKTLHQSWAWIVAAFTGFLEVELEGPAWQAVSRAGFRTVMSELFDAAQRGPHRCLMIHAVENLSLEALDDLVKVFAEYDMRTPDRRFNLLLAGVVDSPYLDVPSVARVVLPDFTVFEAVDALVEHLGPMDRARLESAVGVVGGIPALLEAIAAGTPERVAEVARSRDVMRNVVGPLADEVRGAMDVVNSSQPLNARLEHLARAGAQPSEQELDARLWLAGLVRFFRRDGVERTAIRAPWFADLALAG